MCITPCRLVISLAPRSLYESGNIRRYAVDMSRVSVIGITTRLDEQRFESLLR
jgi:hypothetical protein